MTDTSPTYREIAPPADLADLVECCWVSRGGFDPARKPALQPALQRVLPDGCMDILITLGDFAETLGGGHHTHRAFVVGTMTRAQVFAFSGVLDLIAVRFKPGGARPFLKAPADELVDLGAPLDTFWGEAGRVLPDRLHAAVDDDARAEILFSELRTRRSDGPEADSLIRSASKWIEQTGGAVTVDELRRVLFISERTLERRFKTEIGLTPKQAGRIARFRMATDRLVAEPQTALGRIAYICGYYDQAHFNREFKGIAGMTPGEWRTEQFEDAE